MYLQGNIQPEIMGLYVIWDKRHATAPVFSVCTLYVLLLCFRLHFRPTQCLRKGRKIDGAVLSDGVLIIALAELREITPVSHFLLLSLSRCCTEAQILCPFDLLNCSVYLFRRAFVLPRLPECRRLFRLPTEKTLSPSDTSCPASSVGRMNNVRRSSRI